MRSMPRFAVYTLPAMATPGRRASGAIRSSEVSAHTATGACGSPTSYEPAITGHAALLVIPVSLLHLPVGLYSAACLVVEAPVRQITCPHLLAGQGNRP